MSALHAAEHEKHPRCAHGRFVQFGRVFICDCGWKHPCRCALRRHVAREHFLPGRGNAWAREPVRRYWYARP